MQDGTMATVGACDQSAGHLIFLVSMRPGSLKAWQLGCKRKKAGVPVTQRPTLSGCHIFHMSLTKAIIGPANFQENGEWAPATRDWSPGLHACRARAPRLNRISSSLLLVSLRQGVIKLPGEGGGSELTLKPNQIVNS